MARNTYQLVKYAELCLSRSIKRVPPTQCSLNMLLPNSYQDILYHIQKETLLGDRESQIQPSLFPPPGKTVHFCPYHDVMTQQVKGCFAVVFSMSVVFLLVLYVRAKLPKQHLYVFRPHLAFSDTISIMVTLPQRGLVLMFFFPSIKILRSASLSHSFYYFLHSNVCQRDTGH